MKELYVVYFESANYAGYGEHCLVWATSEEEAKDEAADWAEEFYYDQDNAQWEEENEGQECEMYANVQTAFRLESSEGAIFKQWLKDPSQTALYPIVNNK